jgi:hypothetical protein
MDKEKEKEDDTVIVGFGCQFIDKPIPGSLIRNCGDCGTEVYISPSSQGKKIDTIICIDCYEKNVKEGEYKGKKEEIVTCISEEQIKEFNLYSKQRNGYTMTAEEILRALERKLGRKVIFEKKKEK